MRQLKFAAAISLDGLLARANHAVDWLQWSDEVAQVMAAFWPGIDTVVMGRGTYEAAVAAGHDQGYPGLASYVFSRTLSTVGGGATLVRDDAATFLRRLKDQPGKDICLLGGGVLARSLLEAGILDEISLNIHPILLGAGIPAFHGLSREIGLSLESSRQLRNGCLLVTYRRSPET
jgi:dihydrofolate reductase